MKKILTFFSLFVLILLFVQCEKDKNFHTPISERTLLGETPVLELQPTVIWTTSAEQQETDYFNLTHTIDELGSMFLETEANIASVSYDETFNVIDIVIEAVYQDMTGVSFSEIVSLNLSGIEVGTYAIDGVNNTCSIEINMGYTMFNDELFVGSVTISEAEADYIRGFYSIGEYVSDFNIFCATPPLANVSFGVIEGDFQISF